MRGGRSGAPRPTGRQSESRDSAEYQTMKPFDLEPYRTLVELDRMPNQDLEWPFEAQMVRELARKAFT
jgi:hypothetical protein